MNVYISINASSASQEETAKQLNKAVEFLKNIGHNPVYYQNWHENNAIESSLSYKLKLISLCDGIMMLPGWIDSPIARIELDIARSLDKIIVYPCTINANYKLEQIERAIEAVTGKSFSEYSAKGRIGDLFLLRMIYIKLCRDYAQLEENEIALLVNRQKSMVVRTLMMYEPEKQYNSHFRKIAEKVEFAINANCVGNVTEERIL